MTSSLAQPQVLVLLGLRRISMAVMVEATSTETSVIICPVSVSSANESVMNAATTSTMNTVTVTANVAISRC